MLLVGSDDTLLLRAFQSASTAMRPWCLVPEGAAAGDLLDRSRRCEGVLRADTGGGSFTRDQVLAAADRAGATHIVPVALRDADVVGTGAGLGPVTYPGVGKEARDRIHDKWRFWQLLVEHGIPTPPTVLAADEGEARAAAVELEGEVVVKPVAEAGGTGVFMCTEPGALDVALASWPRWPRLVQRLVPGHDRDVSVLASEGEALAIAVQDRFLSFGLRFVPDPLAVELALEIVRVTGYSGLLHLDMRRRPDGGIEVIEANPRLYATMQLAAAVGMEFVSLGLDVADGWRPRAPLIAPAGVVVPVRGLPEVLRSPYRYREGFSRATARAVGAALRDPRFALSRSVPGAPGP